MRQRRLIVGSFFLILLGCIGANCGVAPGYLEGYLKIVSPRYVELADANVPRATARNYAEYPLVVLNRSGQKEIARLTADANGSYRVELPPGDYVLDVGERGRKRIRAKPQPFTVVSNHTVRVDMNILIGFAKGGPARQ